MKQKEKIKIPKQILDGIQKKTGYSRSHIRNVIKGRYNNPIINYYYKLAQEDFGKFLKETGLLEKK